MADPSPRPVVVRRAAQRETAAAGALRAARSLAIAVSVGLLVAACGGANSTAGNGTAGGSTSDNGKTPLVRYPVGQRPTAPAISGTLITGKTLDLADWRGDVIVVNVWGSWCAPCRAEAQGLKAVSDATRDRGVRFVGMDSRDNDASAKAFERTHGITYPSFRDTAGTLVLRFNGLVPVSAVPSTVVIDRDNRVAARIIGPVTYTTLRDLVKSVAAEKAAPSGGTPR